MRPAAVLALAAALAAAWTGAAGAWEWSGQVAAEGRHFPVSPADPRQHGGNLSLSAEPELYHTWDNRWQSFTFVPFLRWDAGDPERTHFDIRELTWLKADYDWELRVGIRKVFWGVTESQHLVDIINQTDLVENIDTEDKLGQPMINLALIRDWGTLDLFVLPYFRERSFPGVEGRPRIRPPVEPDLTRYESPAGRHHMDFAVRWFRTLGDWDVGLSHFHGTGREPTLVPRLTAHGPVLAPFYPIISQTALDLQAVKGSWLWKLELISRAGQGGRFTAATGGFEYTFVGLGDTRWDLGVIGEYLFDDRGADATTPFEDDVMLGARLALNDVQSSELLAGVILDRHSDARFYNLEASRRLGSNWKLALEARFFSDFPRTDPGRVFRRDDYVQAELAYHF